MTEQAAQQRYPQTWNLDNIFPGGSSSPELAAEIEAIQKDLEGLRAKTGADSPDRKENFVQLVMDLQNITARLREASAFVGCLIAQKTDDVLARQIQGRLSQLGALMGNVRLDIEQISLSFDDGEWKQLMEHPEMAPISFSLTEERSKAAELMDPSREELANNLAVDGYHAWGSLYNNMVGRMKAEVDIDGEKVELSMGQLENHLRTPDADTRHRLFQQWEEAWAEETQLFASSLNHLAGFRLNLYRGRGWDSVLKEPLMLNRMSRETLDAMWDAVVRGQPRLAPYFEAKAKLLGTDGMGWIDVPAPIPGDEADMSYDEGVDFILEQFGRFSPEFEDFARQAVVNRWIEAEDRAGKAPGGFCTSFPMAEETRIFMTFGGTTRSVATLAHELGHAYHQHVVRDLPLLAQRYPMGLAETASTFAENIVTDAAIQHATDDGARRALIEEKLQRAVAFMMNIHCRFLFETRFYEARSQGPLTVDELNDLMQKAQEESYQGLLNRYEPQFWASKLHFHITGMPFYNFPYTFGFLFSTGVYARARQEGPGFADRYKALLQDTGRMTAEDVAHTHLGVDLTKPEFWDEAIDEALTDLDDFAASV